MQIKNNQKDVLEVVEEFSDIDYATILNYLIGIVSDLLKIKINVAGEFCLYVNHIVELREFSHTINRDKLLKYFDKILGLERAALANISLNKELLLQDLLWDIKELCS
jgi:hypothetical protein